MPPRAASSGTPQPGYRPCVGLMLLDAAGRVFVGERRGPAAGWWQMPQGGIDPGESPLQAAWRELREEIGTARAELLAESRGWYAYEVPPELVPSFWGGRYRGQTQKWFALRFTGHDGDIALDRHEPEFSRWRWATPQEALAVVVDFKRPVYRAVLEEFRPLLEAARAASED